MSYYKLFCANWKILLFAIILTFFSGFGQTFLLSLYIPEIIREFQISQGLYSRIYAGATILSGISIIFAGKLIDRLPLIKFTMLVIVGIITANLLAGISLNLFMLFMSIFLLRFFGQGLLTHTSMTAMGRYFSFSRGKALSIAYLGFPMAEAVFPITIVSLIAWVGWRESFLVSAGFIFLILIPVVWWLIGKFRKSQIIDESPRSLKTQNLTQDTREQDQHWRQKDIVRTLSFYVYAPTVFIVGFTLTALFFFQTFIASYKGWTLEWMALNISAYAISSFTFSILAGPIVDRFSARAVFPFTLIPMLAGLLVLANFTHPLSATLYWFLVGISAGANPTISNSLYAETYGVKSLGSIRSIFTFVMVISTAMGPVVYSFLLEKGFSFDRIHIILSGIILLNILFILWGNKKNAESPTVH